MKVLLIALLLGGAVACDASGSIYTDCESARAAGAAPIYSDDPGYRAEFDQDGDGVGCE